MTHVLHTAWISNVDSVMKSLLFLQAGQATEPECLVALGLAAGEDGQVCCEISSSWKGFHLPGIGSQKNKSLLIFRVLERKKRRN